MGDPLSAVALRLLRRVGAPLNYCAARYLAILCLLALILGLAGRTASADIFATGDVYPADNPFPLPDMTNPDEGLPVDGNAINPFEPSNHQTYFEGRHVEGPNPLVFTDDTNINDNIVVGQRPLHSGYLTISEETALRYMNLVIGDQARSFGEMHITGPAALFNSNFEILPPNLPANFQSQKPREGDTRAAATDYGGTTGLDVSADGFDLYVGRSGTAQLFIDLGGRAEIHDAVFVGYNPGSTGTLQVDGFGSLLISGGLDPAPASGDHLMIIGRQGTGFMRVQNGGTVISEAPPAGSGSTATINFGATIGSTPADTDEPGIPGEEGGQGTVTVTGAASEWIIGGSLQIGGFHNNFGGGIGTTGDLEGDDAIYNSNSGTGTLLVEAAGLVHLRPAIDATSDQDPLVLAIGHLGDLVLNGGYLSVGDQADRVAGANVAVFNDGDISGSGRIDTGSFSNRYLGKVSVGAGQKLIIAATAEIDELSMTQVNPLVNFGLIELTGVVDARAEVEFQRAPGELGTPPTPFLNLLLPVQPDPPPPASRGGRINAQHATLRFGTGLLNQSQVSFTAGVNIVEGNVMSIGPELVVPDDGEGDIGDATELLVNGPNTQVIFQNSLGIGGNSDLNIDSGGRIVVLEDFASVGEISVEISRENPSPISVLGDVGLANELNLKLASDAFPLQHGDAFEIINFGGAIGGVDFTDPFNPVPDLTVLPLFSEISVSPDLSLLAPELDVVIQFADEGVYALFLDPTMVGPPGGPGAIGPDFNGDGVVDLEDIAIWLANEGIMSGASVLQGDADGDGDVDGDDLAFILRNLGMPPPWAGGGAGSGSSSGLGANVPEPTGLALLVSGGLLAIACRRQRCLAY